MAKEKYIASCGYRLFKHYVRFLNEHIMYKMIYQGKVPVLSVISFVLAVQN